MAQLALWLVPLWLSCASFCSFPTAHFLLLLFWKQEMTKHDIRSSLQIWGSSTGNFLKIIVLFKGSQGKSPVSIKPCPLIPLLSHPPNFMFSFTTSLNFLFGLPLPLFWKDPVKNSPVTLQSSLPSLLIFATSWSTTVTSSPTPKLARSNLMSSALAYD